MTEPAVAPLERVRPARRKLRVVIADDHRRVREGLRFLLEAEPDFEVVGEADDGLRALELARRERPDVLLLDHEMPGMLGLDVARVVQREEPRVRVVMFTLDETVRSLAAASGLSFLTKDVSNAQLAATVRGLAYGVAPAPSNGTPAGVRELDAEMPEEPANEAPVRTRPVWVSLVPFLSYAAYAVLAYVVFQLVVGTAIVRLEEVVAIILVAELLAAYAFWHSRRLQRRAVERRRQKVRELDMIARAAALYSGPFDLSQVISRFLGQMRSCIGAGATATLIVYDAAVRTFEPIAEVGPDTGAFKRNVYPLVVLPHEIFERVVVQQRTWLVSDTRTPAQSWREFTNFFPRTGSARTICVIPLRARGAAIGVVIVRDPRPAAVDPESLALIETLCHFIAGAVHAATLQFRVPETPATAR